MNVFVCQSLASFIACSMLLNGDDVAKLSPSNPGFQAIIHQFPDSHGSEQNQSLIQADLIELKPLVWRRIDKPSAEFLCRARFFAAEPISKGVVLKGFVDSEGATIPLRRPVSVILGDEFFFTIELMHEKQPSTLLPILESSMDSGERIAARPIEFHPASWPRPIQPVDKYGGKEVSVTHFLFDDITTFPFGFFLTLRLNTDVPLEGLEEAGFDVIDERTGDVVYPGLTLNARQFIQLPEPDACQPFFQNATGSYFFTLRPSKPHPVITDVTITCNTWIIATGYRVVFWTSYVIFGLYLIVAQLRSSRKGISPAIQIDSMWAVIRRWARIPFARRKNKREGENQ